MDYIDASGDPTLVEPKDDCCVRYKIHIIAMLRNDSTADIMDTAQAMAHILEGDLGIDLENIALARDHTPCGCGGAK
jgi:hypothetical protein